MSMRRRPGVALLIALLALLLIGALVSATLLRVQSDVRLARDAMTRQRAEAAAERMIRVTIAATSSATMRALPIGSSSASTVLTNGVTTTTTLVRTDSALVWVVATATAPSVRGVARAQLGASAVIARMGSAPLQILPGDAWALVY